jgi:hypothetical protein
MSEAPLESNRFQVDAALVLPPNLMEVVVVDEGSLSNDEIFVGAPTPPPQMQVVIVNVRDSES